MIELGGAAPKARWSVRLVAAAALAVLVIGGLAVKLAELQVTYGAQLALMARANTVHRVVLQADRGVIYDRHGVALCRTMHGPARLSLKSWRTSLDYRKPS